MAGTQNWRLECPQVTKYKTMYLASFEVKTAFDVAKPEMVAEILEETTGVLGWIIPALPDEMKDLKEMVSFESCETEFMYSRCTRQGSVEALLT